ncbi:MAG: DUF1738 domain-containing protein, partial [Acidobacteriota bacterium]|nr:DUF1738 domain-containing protein [Acidobacteriota bacterium]
LGRHVRRGERALVLCLPITRRRRDEESAPDGSDTFTTFVYQPRWFVLEQTEGEEVTPPSIPEFDIDHALAALEIERIPFDHTDGNCQGFAKKRQIAISPIAQLPVKTLLHEMAHLCCLRSYVALSA